MPIDHSNGKCYRLIAICLIMDIEEEVLRKISPSIEQREYVNSAVRDIISAVREEFKKTSLNLDVMLVGSVAKDTYIGSPDLDVFILFPTTVGRRELQDIGLHIGRSILSDGREHYAEHPYVRGTWRNLDVDLVPCYAVRDVSKIQTSVDRTPFHTKYINSHLKNGQHEQVRLLKQFMKGIGIYGAEASIQGFSGYLVELLILKYGGMRNVLEASATWKKGETISLGERGRHFEDPFIFYDPVDKDRNVSSALSLNNFALFIYAAREYLANPSLRFFFPNERRSFELSDIRNMLDERGTELLVVQIDRPDLIDDDLFPQARRTLKGLTDLLEDAGFAIYDKIFYISNNIYLVVELEYTTLPNSIRHYGPPAWIDNAQSFLDKWSNKGLSEPFLEDGRWSVMIKRDFSEASILVRERFQQTSLGSAFRNLKGLVITSGKRALIEENRAAISALLDKRKNWEI